MNPHESRCWDEAAQEEERRREEAKAREEARAAREFMKIVRGELQALYNHVHTTRAKVLVAAMLAHQDDLIRGIQLVIESLEATTSG